MAEITSIDTRLPYRPINMCEPTAAQRECVRYALTDGECTLHGCRDCPATLYAKELDPNITVASRVASVWELLGWAVVIWVILAGAMSIGLAREAHQIEISERV
jgi:hypothetical protein